VSDGHTLTLDEICDRHRVLVCVGAGGVGKTTVSAALGLAAARRGRRVLVCTIDPARRLATSLGLDAFGNEEVEVGVELLASEGVQLPPGGALHAMMLDTKGTFDRLVQRYASDEQAAARILDNHIYKQLSSQLAGSQEYMAMEKLHELHGSGRFDLIILDTPPTRHALDFLQAPERLARFFDVSVVRWFVAPFREDGARRGVAARMAGKVIDWLGGVFGGELLRELGEFFAALETLWGGFRERAQRVKGLLGDGGVSAFVVVSSAAKHAVTEACYFEQELRAHGMPLAGFVANRVHRLPGAGGLDPDAPAGPGADSVGDGEDRRALMARVRAGAPEAGTHDLALVGQALDLLLELGSLARSDHQHLQPLRALAAGRRLVYREIPALETDVHSVAGLARLDGHLMSGAPGPRRPAEIG
jgi:anion-transporting  ArsA/GET3 family ATPase